MKCTSLYILFKEMNGGRASAHNMIISRSIPKIFFPLHSYQTWNDIMKTVYRIQLSCIIARIHIFELHTYIHSVDKIIKSSKYQTERIIISSKISIEGN